MQLLEAMVFLVGAGIVIAAAQGALWLISQLPVWFF